MASVGHELEYWLTRGLVATARTMSPRAADNFAVSVGSLLFRVLGSRRRIALDNLRRAFGERYSEDDLMAITERVFQNTARTFVEMARFARASQSQLEQTIDFSHAGEATALARSDRPVIIVTAHFGNWEMLGVWTKKERLSIGLTVGRQHNPKVNELLRELRGVWGMKLFEMPDETRGAYKHLKDGNSLLMVADQHAPAKSVIIDFMGRPAATPEGPALLALRADCPVVPVLMKRERYDRHVMMVGNPIRPPESGSEQEKVLEITRAYTAYFEAAIRQCPEQWLWTHRRWKV